MIEQQHNAIGRWELSLKPGVPKHIRDAFENFGHVVITPGELRGSLDRSTLLANSMYTGLMLKYRKRFDLSVEMEGSNLLTWLGYSDDRGPFPTDVGLLTSNPFTWADFVSTSTAAKMGVFRPIHDATNGIELGTVYGSTTFSGVGGISKYQITRTTLGPNGLSRKFLEADTAIDQRVTPAGVYESGNPTSDGFFRLVPEVILTRDVSTKEPALRSLQIADIEVEYDGTTYATHGAVTEASTLTTVWSGPIANPVRNFTGSSGAKWGAVAPLDGDSSTTAAAREVAAGKVLAAQGESTNIKVSVQNHPTLPTFLEPGDYIWIYDPDTGLADTGNDVLFGGRRLTPVKVRIYGTRWPVTQGRGVYYANNDWSTIVDLAPYMEWEDGPVDLEAGAPLQSLIEISQTTLRRIGI